MLAKGSDEYICILVQSFCRNAKNAENSKKQAFCLKKLSNATMKCGYFDAKM
jgi:hypothetical protein